MDELISQLEKYTSISPKGHKAFDEYLKEKFDEYCAATSSTVCRAPSREFRVEY